MSLPVFSLFPYSKKGDPEAIDMAKKIVASIKACRIGFMDTYLVKYLSEENRGQLSSFINSAATLVPVPKSAPLVEKALWPSKEICEFLIRNGFGKSYSPIIRRQTAVQKAAFQHSSEDRPSVKAHFDSIILDSDPLFNAAVQEIILVDDVVTQGRTAYACYQKVAAQFPGIPVKLFALVRSTSFEKLTEWNSPASSDIIYYPQSGKTFHKIQATDEWGGLWGE